MRNLSFCKEKWDKRFFLAFIIAVICAIICGIVLCVQLNSNIYLRNLASNYIFNVYNFKNTPLFFSHFLSDLLYFYVCFLIGYCTKFKYLSLILIFIRGLFFGVYCVLLFTVGTFGGGLAAIIVFIPSTLISLCICYFFLDLCRCFNNKYIWLLPLIVAVANGIILMLLINVVFRVVIIIV